MQIEQKADVPKGGAIAKIRPIIIFPFRHRDDEQHITALYESISKRVQSARNRYEKPITVLNRQTFYKNEASVSFQRIYQMAEKYSQHIENVWCVDTCQMWLAGFGVTYRLSLESRSTGDVSWLIPGDFDYANSTGKKVLEAMYKIPESLLAPDSVSDGKELCIGQLQVPENTAKHLIDTYGTYGLLHNWFPEEAAYMRNIGIIRPRSEFFAIDHKFLRRAMVDNRWFAYEQTIALILEAPKNGISVVDLGTVMDPEESRDTLALALQQIERTERVLKVSWRDKKGNVDAKEWVRDFRELEHQSREIVSAAITVCGGLLRLHRHGKGRTAGRS